MLMLMLPVDVDVDVCTVCLEDSLLLVITVFGRFASCYSVLNSCNLFPRVVKILYS